MGQRKGAKRQGMDVSRTKHDRSLQVLSNLLWFSSPFVFLLEVRYNFSTSRKKESLLEYWLRLHWSYRLIWREIFLNKIDFFFCLMSIIFISTYLDHLKFLLAKFWSSRYTGLSHHVDDLSLGIRLYSFYYMW